MQDLFRHALLACLLLAGAQGVHAQGERGSVVISTGLEGGGYWSAGERLRAVAAEVGVDVENRSSSGSLMNLERLFDSGSPVSLAFAQADAVEYFAGQNPEIAPAIGTLHSIGQECVFIISRSDDDIKTLKDMRKSERMQLGIKSPQSGIWVTYHSMMQRVPGLDGVTLIYGDTIERMNHLLSPLTNIDRAVMVVHGTDAHSPEIEMAAKDPDNYRFVDIEDERLTRAVDGGEPLYQRKKVRSGVAEESGKVETICVRGPLVANRNKLTSAQFDAVQGFVQARWAEIHPEP